MLNYSWRITKYNPANRKNGAYVKGEWTSLSDVGKLYQDGVFSVNEYLQVEKLYVSAVCSIMGALGIESLQVKNLEKDIYDFSSDKFSYIYPEEMQRLYANITEGDSITVEQVEILCKLILREKLWCKLENELSMFAHFGFDYYMYIGASSPCNKEIQTIESWGLFVESQESPYLD